MKNGSRNMLILLSVLLCWTAVSESRWANNLGGMLSRSCMYSFGISGIKSEFEGTHGDRLWEIQCSKIGFLEGDDICMWTYDFVNEIGKKLKFSCKDDQYISGLYADYNDTMKDRVWRLECCSSPGVELLDCVDTDWLNKYGEPISLQLEPKQVLHGVVSVFRAEERDRKWKFTVCDVSKTKRKSENDEPNST